MRPEVPSLEPTLVALPADQEGRASSGGLSLSVPLAMGYLAIGAALGFVFVRSEVASWYRIQEMFRFQSFHMYGIIGSALAVAWAGLSLLRMVRTRALSGDAIEIRDKDTTATNVRYWLGGAIFGFGWALLGACPGPIFALIGSGHSVYVVALASAVAGTYAYARVQRHLPH